MENYDQRTLRRVESVCLETENTTDLKLFINKKDDIKFTHTHTIKIMNQLIIVFATSEYFLV